MKHSILMTGASGGFGQLITRQLLEQGHHVWAGLRDAQGRNAEVARELEAAGAEIVELDVTSDASVEQAITTVFSSENPPDTLINNAGVGTLGLQEAFTAEQYQSLFDINVFGVHRLTRAVLPHFRSAGGGHLMFVSSLLGRMTIPFYGPYNASKWALEAMAENYRTELSRYAIDVSIVEPGGYPTSFVHNLAQPADEERLQSLGEYAQAPTAFLQGFEQALANNPAQDPADVAEAVCGLVEAVAGERAFRTVVDKMGMGDAINGYNENLHQLTAGTYGAFGIGDMLKLAGQE